MVTRRYLIEGRVQGVGFRRYTCARAREIGVIGWARNLRDGRVEVLAQGTEEQLRLLKSFLQAGPAASYVEKVEENNIEEKWVTQELQSQTFEQVANGEMPWKED